MIQAIKQFLKKILTKLKRKQNIYNTTISLNQHKEIGLDNDFIRLKRTNATLRTNKLLSLIFSYLDFKNDNKDSNGEILVTISNSVINNFISKNGVKNNNSSFKEVANDIISTSIVTGSINGLNVAFPVIDYMQENENKSFTFRLNSIFTPYIQELKYRYSVLQLETIRQFTSNYGFLLYQELMSWYVHSMEKMTVKEQYYSTSQLFNLFNLEKTDYHWENGKFDRYNFEKKVIKQAVDDINSVGELRVIWEKIKQGNGVKAYKFTYGSIREMKRNAENRRFN